MGEATARLLVILGSGETAPSMTTTHQAVLARLPDKPEGLLLDTTYGFQDNAEAITERLRSYFRDQVGIDARTLSLRRTDDLEPTELEQALRDVRRADWVFAGPGSPSYAVRHLGGGALSDALRARLRQGGAVVFASAAACTLGRLCAPVYEIYKAGADPHWLPGLDLASEAGLDAVVLPHYDNTEGGTHDTRFCYLGARRLEVMEAQLPDGVWVLGVDEHTAAVVDLDDETVTVRGRGGVTVRTGRGSTSFPAGATVTLDEVRAVASAGAGLHRPAAPAPSPGTESMADLERRFAAALARDDAMDALAAALEAERQAGRSGEGDGVDHARRLVRSMLVDLATTAQRGLHEHRRLVAPFVQAVLELRSAARGRGDYALADSLRDRLAAGGVDVHDTPDGPAWTFHEPHPPG